MVFDSASINSQMPDRFPISKRVKELTCTTMYLYRNVGCVIQCHLIACILKIKGFDSDWSNTTEVLFRNSFFQLWSKLGWMLFSVARVLRSFSLLSNSITRYDLNLALKFLLCLDMIMNPLFRTDFSISNSLKSVRKNVLIYKTIIYFIIYSFRTASISFSVPLKGFVRFFPHPCQYFHKVFSSHGVLFFIVSHLEIYHTNYIWYTILWCNKFQTRLYLFTTKIV